MHATLSDKKHMTSPGGNACFSHQYKTSTCPKFEVIQAFCCGVIQWVYGFHNDLDSNFTAKTWHQAAKSQS